MDDKHPKEYNRIVPFKYFNQENKETIYALGPVEEREAVLIFNEKTKTVPEEVIEYFIWGIKKDFRTYGDVNEP